MGCFRGGGNRPARFVTAKGGFDNLFGQAAKEDPSRAAFELADRLAQGGAAGGDKSRGPGADRLDLGGASFDFKELSQSGERLAVGPRQVFLRNGVFHWGGAKPCIDASRRWRAGLVGASAPPPAGLPRHASAPQPPPARAPQWPRKTRW